ncbi:MAG: rRNA maturation RNase YbeY [Acidobacteriota bacterium]|nr:rRNA maturation RNase YbeY [Acidobacteriota bacterium]
MITVVNRQRKHKPKPAVLGRLLERLCRHYGHEESDVTLVLAGDRAVRTLNRQYRRLDRTTDVLSFPIKEKSAEGRHYLGDLIIAVPTAFRQARIRGHSLDRELRTLVIHGFLHLVGFDHEKRPGDRHEETEALRLFLEEET